MKDKLLIKLAENQEFLLRMIKRFSFKRDEESNMELLQEFYLYCYEKDYDTFSVERMFDEDGVINGGLLYRILQNFVSMKRNQEIKRLKMLSGSINSDYMGGVDPREGVEERLAYEMNMNTLDILIKKLSKDDYNTLLAILNLQLLSSFRDKNGVADMKAYHSKRYQVMKKFNEVVKDSLLHKYVTKEDIGFFDKFE